MELFQLWHLLQKTIGPYKHLEHSNGLKATIGHAWALVGTRGHSWALVGTRGHLWALSFSISTPRVPRVPVSARKCPQVPMTPKSIDFTKLRSPIMFKYILKPKQILPNSPNLIKWSCFNFDTFFRRLLVHTNILNTQMDSRPLLGMHGHSWALVGTYGHSVLVFQRPECPWPRNW